MAAPYHGMSTLTAANLAFLAECCQTYRKDHRLTRTQAAYLCGVVYEQWCAIEANRYGIVGLFQNNSVTAKIINVVLAVSPVCRKGESPHIQPATGDSHGTKEEDLRTAGTVAGH